MSRLEECAQEDDLVKILDKDADQPNGGILAVIMTRAQKRHKRSKMLWTYMLIIATAHKVGGISSDETSNATWFASSQINETACDHWTVISVFRPSNDVLTNEFLTNCTNLVENLCLGGKLEGVLKNHPSHSETNC